MRILPSKRAYLYVFEHARIDVRDGRVEYESARDGAGYNIPIANTMFVMIGPGSSITNEAVRHLRSEGVCIGFCGSGGSPLLAADDPYPNFLAPADEYREPKYLQDWIEVFRDENRRLQAAKSLMLHRLDQIERCWEHIDSGLEPPATRTVLPRIKSAPDPATLMGIEGNITKNLYATSARYYGFDGFQRERGTKDPNEPNTLLDHGNYLAYGLASVVLWCLGIPASLAAMHGKTRRGGLVFDVADVIKDAIVLPTAFQTAFLAKKEGKPVDETEFRAACLASFTDLKALDSMFDAMIEATEC